jgi:hypothetical protein
MATQKRIPKFKLLDQVIAEREQQLANADDARRQQILDQLAALRSRKQDFERREITERSRQIISTIARYRFIPSSHITRLVAGDPRTTHEHLQILTQRGLIKRFQLKRNFEFAYYLDNPEALVLLASQPYVERQSLPWADLKRNQEGDYANAALNGQHVKLAFLWHELMVSRFHFMLEMACKTSSEPVVELAAWRQGPELSHYISIPTLVHNPHRDRDEEDPENLERVNHEPDAFFTLRVHDDFDEPAAHHFMYEADRATMPIPDMKQKFRAHHHYIVTQKKHREHYNIQRIRAVLVETLHTPRAEELLAAVEELRVVTKPLFLGDKLPMV